MNIKLAAVTWSHRFFMYIGFEDITFKGGRTLQDLPVAPDMR
jgi:hypothetical protein